jgi:hypothetical protein
MPSVEDYFDDVCLMPKCLDREKSERMGVPSLREFSDPGTPDLFSFFDKDWGSFQ